MLTREPVSRRILRNTAVAAGARVWLIACNLALAPLVLSHLGQDRFGLWALFWSLLHYVLLLDLGVGTALVKHFAEHHARDDVAGLGALLRVVLVAYAGLSAAVLAVLWPVVGWLPSVLAIPDTLVAEAVVVFRGGLVVLALVNLVTVLDALLKALGRLDLAHLALVVASVPNVAGSVLALRAGWGLPGLVVVVAGVYLLQLGLLTVLVRRLLPAVRLGGGAPRWDRLAALGRYGAPLQVARLADLLNYQVDKVVLGVLTPIRYVAFYELGAKVALLIHEVSGMLVAAVFPAASELHGGGDRARLWRLYERGTKYLWLVTVPTLAGTWLTAHLVLRAWLGHVSADVHVAVLTLAGAYWAVASLSMVTSIGAGIGWTTPMMRASLVRGALGLGLSIALGLAWGYRGVLVGTALALLAGSLVMLVAFCRAFDRSLRDHAALLARVAAVNTPAIAAGLAYVLWTAPAAEAGRLEAVQLLLGAVAIYVVTYAASIRLSGIVDGEDSALLGDVLPVVRWLARPVA